VRQYASIWHARLCTAVEYIVRRHSNLSEALVLNKIFKQQFDELEVQASQVEGSKTQQGLGYYVDDELLLSWKVKVKNLFI
jgi:hypothetical protein